MSREDIRRVIAVYREKLGPLVDDTELGSLMSQIEGYVIDMLGSRAPEDASLDRAAFETVSECLVRSGLVYEAKLEDSNGEYALTVTDLLRSVGASPDRRAEGVVGELIQLLIDAKIGKKYYVQVTHEPHRTVFKFKREHWGS